MAFPVAVRATAATLLLSVACTTFGTAAVDAGPTPPPDARDDATRDPPPDARAAPGTDAAPADALDSAPDGGPAPKRVFVTQRLVAMPQAGAAGLDLLCAAEAGAASGWMAWASSGNVDAAQRFRDRGMVGPWVLTAPGAPVVTTADELLAPGGRPAVRIPIDASFGGAPVAGFVWTGVAAGGASSDNCGDWSILVGEKGVVGLSTASDARWTEATALECAAATAHLYCFER